MIEKSYPSPQAVRAFPWPLRAVETTAHLAEALRELAAAQDTIANLQALNASLARSLDEAHKQVEPLVIKAQMTPDAAAMVADLAKNDQQKELERIKSRHAAQGEELDALRSILFDALGTTDPEAVKAKLTPRFARDPVVLTIPVAPPPPPAPAPKTYRPKCRTCGVNFNDPNQYAKKCPECIKADAIKPARPIGRPPAKKTQPKAAKATKPAPPADEDEDAPIVPQRPTIACAGCNHSKKNVHSETGWECTISRYRDCMPWTFAHLKSSTPSTPAR